MKKILLIGDSIRQGYDKYVKYALKDVCEVYYPSDNCRFAEYVLRHLPDWKDQLSLGDDVDVVHWNAGLWDSLVWFEDGPLTPPDIYAYYIARICRLIQKIFPKAKVIFATSTPVLEERFLNPKRSYRKNSDIAQYNEIAAKIAKEHGFYVNDLYAVVKDVPKSYYSDMTHLYTPGGTQLLADAVLEAIGAALGEKFAPFTLSDYQAVKEIVGH